MNYAHLRAFHAVASYGSFTRAAAAYHITQPTLSAQLKALEQHYGVRLLERQNRKVQLTDLGSALFKMTQRLFSIEAEIERLLGDAHNLQSGYLRIGADAPYHVMPLIAAFNRLYPNIQFNIEFGNSQRILKSLLEQQSDIAILPNIKTDKRLHTVALRPDKLVILVAHGHAWSTRRSIHLQELASQRLILRERGSTTRAIIEQALARHKITINDIHTLEIGSREGVREAAVQGLGVGIIAANELGHDERLHTLNVRDAKLNNLECVACLQSRYSETVIQAFFALLADYLH